MSDSANTRLNDVAKPLGQYFGLLFAIIGFISINTNKEKSLLMMALAFMVTIYYMVLVLVKVMEFQVPFMMMVNLLLGIVVSLLALVIISPSIGWIYLGLCIFVIAFLCYKKGKYQIYALIPKRIKSYFERSHNNDNNEMSPTSEEHDIERLPV